jgi:Glycosyl transferases group 1
MDILALVDPDCRKAYRYRIEAHRRAFHELGMNLREVPLGRKMPIRAIREADLVIVQSVRLHWWQLHLIRLTARRLVFDYDELVRPGESISSRKFARTVRAADAVVVGNQHFQRMAAPYVEMDRVHMVPTCLQVDQYLSASHRRWNEKVKLAWLTGGYPGNVAKLILPLLRAVGHSLPNVRLLKIGDRLPLDLPRVDVQSWDWSQETESSDLADADIGISWLPEDRSTLGCGHLPLISYMAAGLPVVANPVGENRRLITDGENGLFATTPRQWSEAVSRLAGDPGLRRRMGATGKSRVRRDFETGSWGNRFASIMLQTASNAPVTVPEPSGMPLFEGMPIREPEVAIPKPHFNLAPKQMAEEKIPAVQR